MAKENSVIQMYEGAAGTVSIDVPDDGLLLAVDWHLMATLNADGEGSQATLEWSSTTAAAAHDSRSVLSRVMLKQGILTTGGSIVAVNHHVSFGDGIKVFGGERLYMLASDIGSGLTTHCAALLLFNFATFVARRR